METLSLLLCLKLKFPGHVTLLRGNHEVSSICSSYIVQYALSYIVAKNLHVSIHTFTKINSHDKLHKCMVFMMNAIENMAMHQFGVTVFNALIHLVLVLLLMAVYYVFMEVYRQTFVPLIKYVQLIDNRRYHMRVHFVIWYGVTQRND